MNHPFRIRACAAVLLCAIAAPGMAQTPKSSAPADGIAPPAASAASAAPAAPVSPTAGAGEVRALVVAQKEATISSQFAGRLSAVPRQVGDTFRQGDLLATFDCQERQASVKAAEAELMGARETHLAKLKLQSLGAVSDLDVTMAAAAAEKAKSQLGMMQAQEKYCTVNAPYAGKVVRVRAKAYESVALGQPLLEIVDLASLRAQLFVPSTWVRWVKPGTRFNLAVDETGQSYQARVSKISGRIDGASQTVEVLATFDRIPANVLPGMIGKAKFEEAR